jgi:isopenicillin N synthase-like dioxygenase
MIPVIALDRDKAAVAADIRAACESTGFFYATRHGIPEAMVADTFAWAARFFALPEAAKEEVSLFKSSCRRGWEGVGAQTLDAGAKPDQKESFYSGIDHPPDHPNVVAGLDCYGANSWPAALPGFAPAMEAYTAAMLGLAERVMRLMALSLDLPEDYFDPTMHEPMVTLRLVRYPPHPADAPPDLFGAGAHTDWGAITLLAQDASGGLEVRGPDGAWIPATPIPGSFVVNLGDMIPRWTNGRYTSTLHRVINRVSAGDRYSVPFFYSPNFHARISAVPSCVGPGNPDRFTACTAGEHMAEMYRKSYGLAA